MFAVPLSLLALLIAFQVKHFVADYPLQTPWMLGKFKKEGWMFPLAAHSAVHALFTFVIGWLVMQLTLFETNQSLLATVALLDFSIHFTMDRIKASPSLLGRYKALSANEFRTADAAALRSNRYFWWALGFDQLVHHITDCVSIYLILSFP